MVEFEPFDTGVEIKGQAVLSVIAGVPDVFEDRAREILADNGIEEIDADSWHSQEAYLDAYRQITEQVGETTLQQVARSTPDNAEWPPDVETPMDALESIDDAYHLNHRGGEIGSYDVTSTGETSAEVRCETPYPCIYDQGLVEGTVGAFNDGFANINEVGDDCREDGADACVYEVEW